MRSWQRRLESLLRPGPGRRPWLPALGALVPLLWLLSGFYQVTAGERGVLLRFGRLAGVMPAGLHWHLPWPMESVHKVNVEAVNPSEYQARVLTRDVTLVDLRFAVQYRITDPIRYLFSVSDPERVLSQANLAAIREVAGSLEADEVLSGSTRPRLTQAVQSLIQRTLDEYGAGILITSVNLTDVGVPEAVKAAQLDANKALADQERTVKEAHAYASSVLPVARGAASGIGQQAQGYRAQVLEQAQAQAASFGQILDAYNQAPAVTRRRLYMDTMEAVLSQSRKVVVDQGSGARSSNLFYLPLDKLLEKSLAQGETPAPPPGGPAAGPPAGTPPDTATVEAPRGRGER